jgi:hypothetical protein
MTWKAKKVNEIIKMEDLLNSKNEDEWLILSDTDVREYPPSVKGTNIRERKK